MGTPDRTAKHALVASLVLEAARKTELRGPRPSEEEIVAWAEGRLGMDHAARVQHWVAHDEASYACYRVYREYAAPAVAEPEALAGVAPPTTMPVPPDPREVARPVLWERVRELWQRWIPVPVAATALATLVALFIVVPLLPTRHAPLALEDYGQMVPDAAENWRYGAAPNASNRSASATTSTDARRALRFGMRSALLDLGIGERASVRSFFDALPVDYPICESAESTCERLHTLLYELGRWAVLSERGCNTSLRPDDRDALLAAQTAALERLREPLGSTAIAIDEELRTLLSSAVKEADVCRMADALFRWSLS